MGVTEVNATVSIGSNNTITVTGCNTDVSANVSIGELSWKEQAVEPETPTNVITHANLKRPIKSMVVVDGTPMDWAKVGAVRTYTYDEDGAKISGTLTFPFNINDKFLFEYK